MTIHLSRRAMLTSSAGLLAFAGPARANMPVEGPDTPKICLGALLESELNPRGLKRYRQIGVTHVILGNAGFPWTAETCSKSKVAILKASGMYCGRHRTALRRRVRRADARDHPGPPRPRQGARRCEIGDPRRGAAGIPVVEYNFYAHRLEEGYFRRPRSRARRCGGAIFPL